LVADGTVFYGQDVTFASEAVFVEGYEPITYQAPLVTNEVVSDEIEGNIVAEETFTSSADDAAPVVESEGEIAPSTEESDLIESTEEDSEVDSDFDEDDSDSFEDEDETSDDE
jgi:hypothetical protein